MSGEKMKPLSGGAKIARAGRKPILLAVTPEEHEKIKRAADADSRPMSRWVIMAAIAACGPAPKRKYKKKKATPKSA